MLMCHVHLLNDERFQNTQVNHGLMMNAKMPSKIAKGRSENIQHRRTLAISVSSGRKLEEY
jgi:hypothetical protein